MEHLSAEVERQLADIIPHRPEPEAGDTLNHKPSPGANRQSDPVTDPKTHATRGKSAAQHAAAAKAPAKATKKPLLDPEQYRNAKAPAADEMFSEGVQTTIPVRKPGKLNFFRVHADEEYRLYNVPVLEDDKRETYILAAELEVPEDLQRFVSHVNLVTCINHRGPSFFGPIKTPRTTGRGRRAASLARPSPNGFASGRTWTQAATGWRPRPPSFAPSNPNGPK